MSIGIDPGSQLAGAASAFLMGVLLGLVYELLRLVRRHFGGRLIPAVCDIVFCTAAAAAFFLHGMSVGQGRLRLYMAAAALAGAMAYFAAFGAAVRRAARWLYRCLVIIIQRIAGPVGFLLSYLKKYMQILKNIFSSLKKRFRISENRISRTGRGPHARHSEEKTNEIHKVQRFYKDSDTGSHRICYDQPRISK